MPSEVKLSERAPRAAVALGPAAKVASAPAALTALQDEQLAEILAPAGQPAYRLGQVNRWLYQLAATSWSQMTDLPASLRQALQAKYALHSIAIAGVSESADGVTRKLLFTCADGALLEAVLLPRKSGSALCISSQAGCAMGCPFCATGLMGFRRNLSAGEILDQFLLARSVARQAGSDVESIVFMGMGEPLANMENVRRAVERLVSPAHCGFGARRITISTIGLPDRIPRLARWPWKVGLAVSLHAPNDDLRRRLVPPSRGYPIQDLMRDCVYHQQTTGRRVTYEYVMLRGVNDLPAHGVELGALLRGQLCHVNLIPYNPVGGAEFHASSAEAVREFRAGLEAAHIPVTVRKPRGRDIDAACGQLAARAARIPA